MNSWKVYVGGAIYLVVTEYCLETFPSWDPHLVDITGTSFCYASLVSTNRFCCVAIQIFWEVVKKISGIVLD